MNTIQKLGFSLLMLTAPLMATANSDNATAIFAGGCFWCMEKPFDDIEGVFSTTSGYIGGHKQNPSYKQVSAGSTGHTEAVKIIYDPKKVSYAKLLDKFWRNIDPTVKDRQFCDAGPQYRSGIFYLNEQQKNDADASKRTLSKNKPFSAKIVTEITKASQFWPAEDYHQNYYQENPIRYRYYRHLCGRDDRLEELWGEATSH